MKEFHDSTRSELDFEQLPPALRRKFFSSLERLRLAQDGVLHPKIVHEFPRPLTTNTNATPATRISRRPSHTSDGYLARSTSFTRNRLRKLSRPTTRSYSITQEDVARFASLPPTIRRKQFSREDQILLASRINSVILDAADEAIYKQYQWSHLRSRRYLQALHSKEHFRRGDIHIDDNDSSDMNSTDMESLRWLDESNNLDLSLHDYHAAVVETATKDRIPASSKASRRSLSISNISFNKHTSFKKPTSARNSLSTSTRPSTSLPLPITTGHHKHKTSVTSLEPAATHYQDPAARMKLRVYLASPQKFDEAVEFGFPSLQDQTNAQPTRPKTSSRTVEDSPRTFFNDDTPSLSEGEDKDFEDVDSPRTPSASAFSSVFSSGLSHDSSLDRASFRPKIIREVSDYYPHVPVSNREMTLHMTLTRPDLRSPDDMLSPRNVNAMPLEQPPLEFADNSTAFWDSLPDEESKVKKLFKKLKWRA